MARMLPTPMRDDVTSGAERRLYAALRDQLDQEYTVLHSVRWTLRDRRGYDQDGEIDFVIVHRRLGVLLLEVKGGGIEVDANGWWYSINLGGTKYQLKRSPFEQVENSMYSLRDKLSEAPATRRHSYRVLRAVALPDSLVEGNLALNAPRELTIDSADLRPGQLSARIKRIFGQRDERQAMSEAAHADLLDLLQPTGLIARPALGYQIDESEAAIVTLSRQQRYVLDLLASHREVLIAGCAGSGKTMLALTKAKQLASEGFRVLLTCFNVNLATWLRQNLAEFTPMPPGSLTVQHYHGLVETLCREAGQPVPKPPAGSDADAVARYWNETLPELLAAATPSITTRFDAIIADEGQDFRELWWATMSDLLADHEQRLFYIFYDQNQALYASERHFPITAAPYHLLANHRNTGPIHGAAIDFYAGDPKPRSEGPTGPAPDFRPVTAATERGELRQVLDGLLRRERLAPADIVILTPRSARASVYRAGDKIGPVTLTWSPQPGPGEIRVCTIHAFKGLEAPVVIVVEATQLPTHTNRQYLLYVAFSRARSHLIVLAEPAALAAAAAAPTAGPAAGEGRVASSPRP